MGKRKTYNGGILAHIGGFAAFAALFLSGIVYVLGLFDIKWSFFSTIQPWLLLFGIGFTGWVYLCSINPPGPDLLWKVLYLSFLILAFMGAM